MNIFARKLCGKEVSEITDEDVVFFITNMDWCASEEVDIATMNNEIETKVKIAKLENFSNPRT